MRTAGVRVALALSVILIFSIGVSLATTRTVSWGPVTTYTDGSPIEAGNAVTYSGWRQDNVTKTITQFADRISVTASTFDDSTLVKGRAYNFWLQTHLSTGASSDNSPMTSWLVPLGKANYPVPVVQ